MAALVVAVAVLSLLQTPSSPPARHVTLKTGDTVLVSAGTDAHIVSRRTARLWFAVAAGRREVVVLVDEEKDSGPPDGLVDRVYRYTLQDDFPEQYVFRGEGAIEEDLEIKDGDIRRPTSVTFVTPAGRIRLAGPFETIPPGTILIRATGSTARTLSASRDTSSRAFEAVEHTWINHLEEQGTENWPPRPGGEIRAPRLISERKPDYTPDAMRRHVEGRVELDVIVAVDGSVSDARVVRPLDPDLDAEALRTVKKWRFVPASRNGQPVPVTVSVEMTFTLRKTP